MDILGVFLKVCCVHNELGHWSSQSSKNLQAPQFTAMGIIIGMVGTRITENPKPTLHYIVPKEPMSESATDDRNKPNVM